MRKNLICMILILVAQDIYAGAATGKVLWLRVRASDNLHYFKVDGDHNSRPTCATSTAWAIKDENSAAGKTQISILLAAWASGRPITVNGDNKCSRWGDIEDANEIFINQS